MTERRFGNRDWKGWLVAATIVGGMAIGIASKSCELDEQRPQETTTLDDPDIFNPPQRGEQNGNNVVVSPTATRPFSAEEVGRLGEIPQSIIDYAGGAGYIQTFGNKTELVNFLRSIYSRPQDRQYTGIYFFPEDLHEVPDIDEGTVTYYDAEKYRGQMTGYAVPFNETDPSCASWKYPGGTILRITNKETGVSGYCVVNDRGPNRLHGGNQDRSRYLADLTPSLYYQINPRMDGETEVIIEPVGFISYWIQAHPEFPPPEASIPSWALSSNMQEQMPLKFSQKVIDKLNNT